ncbi:glycosyltransferase family 2 protein [Arthrobacter pascens]|uniref:glycosyltransferase family 2 protein n=1 Tax=Arthrobacter pascens TaxID=1677 RepID=UPI00196BA05D|nr:glycosyltransferase family 2 protein [Arthrobacter pascens]MBN3496651.1 glycosyltransferase family 2 protein [Arthrobacter pascens]
MLQSGISVSIVTYNTWERTTTCIASIIDSHSDLQIEVLVHDNGSEPAPGADWPDYVRIFKSPNNLGFGAGHNANLNLASYDTFLILNPDVSIDGAALISLSSALREDQTVGAAPLLIYPDGTEQLSVRRLPSARTELARMIGADRRPNSRWSTLVRVTPGIGPLEVEQPAAAVLAVRTETLRAIGGFDVAFPMYFEDVDLCARLRTKGRIVLLTDSQAIHDGEGTAKHYRTATTFWIENSRRRYHRKFASGPIRPVILTAAWISVLTHFTALTAKAWLRSGDERSMLFAKARGYGLALVATFAGSDDYWRRRFLKS